MGIRRVHEAKTENIRTLTGIRDDKADAASSTPIRAIGSRTEFDKPEVDGLTVRRRDVRVIVSSETIIGDVNQSREP